ncbi:MAG: hypothetical protein ACMUEM_06750 [Flavobacteriales bacterium AspAUS03]
MTIEEIYARKLLEQLEEMKCMVFSDAIFFTSRSIFRNYVKDFSDAGYLLRAPLGTSKKASYKFVITGDKY